MTRLEKLALACVVCLGGLPVMGGCGDDFDPAWLFPGPPVAGFDEPVALDALATRVEGYIGSEDGPLAFGSIAAVAVGPSQVVAVADATACVVALVRGGTLIGRFGRCGGGPGEFQRIQALAFHHDSVVVYDAALHRVIFFEPGTGGLRLLTPQVSASVGLVSDMRVLDDSTLVFALERLPGGQETARAGSAGPSSPDQHDGLLVLISSSTGELRRAFLPDAPASVRNASSALRGALICVGRPDSGGPLIAVMSRWHFEGLIVDPERGPRAHFATAVEGIGPRETEANVFHPGGVSSLTCDDEFVVLKRNHVSHEGGRRRTDWGLLEVRRFDGALVHRQFFAATDSAWLGRLAAARNGSVYVAANSQYGYPRIVEVKLEQKGDTSPRRPLP